MNGQILEETQPGLNPEGYVSIPFLFQGQYYDYETGLAYNRFRYYDPELGRYISQDPIGLLGGLALHAYVKDTNVWIDVFGESPATINRHHLIPQEMLEDSSFMRQLKSIGIKDPRGYVHRQTADITESKHKALHKGAGGGAWNSDFKRWYNQNPSFTKKKLQHELRYLMKKYNVPMSSRNFSRKYGRKTKKRTGYSKKK